MKVYKKKLPKGVRKMFKYEKGVKVKILNSLLFTLNLTLIYFKIFYFINDGMINSTFIIITIITFSYFNNKNLQKKCKNIGN